MKSRRMKWSRHLACVGAEEVRGVLVGKHEKERIFGRPERRREDNSKMDFQEAIWGNINWFHILQARNRGR